MSDDSTDPERVVDPEAIRRHAQLENAISDAMCEVGADDAEYLDTISNMLVRDLIRIGTSKEEFLKKLGVVWDLHIEHARTEGRGAMS